MIIGFSGRKQSGKDTSGSIAQILLNSPQLSNEGVKDFLRKQVDNSNSPYYKKWAIKKFADKLKDITCLLIGCTREQLEDEVYKNTILGEDWWCIKKWYPANPNHKTVFTLYPYIGFDSRIFDGDDACMWVEVKMTPRLLLQLIGTECGRQILHPNIWVNSTMADYKAEDTWVGGEESVSVNITSMGGHKGISKQIHTKESFLIPKFPDWIITDMRFPNEAEVIKQKEGILVRIERPWFYKLLEDGRHEFSDKEDRSGHVYIMAAKYSKEEAEVLYQNDFKEKVHESETALDDYEGFDHVITNDGTIDDLINYVRELLLKHELLTQN